MLILNGYKFLYAIYLMLILNDYKFLYVYAIDLMLILNDYKFLYVYAIDFFIFGRGPCHIVVLGGPRSQKGA